MLRLTMYLRRRPVEILWVRHGVKIFLTGERVNPPWRHELVGLLALESVARHVEEAAHPHLASAGL